jgi:hypothetical protein
MLRKFFAELLSIELGKRMAATKHISDYVGVLTRISFLIGILTYIINKWEWSEFLSLHFMTGLFVCVFISINILLMIISMGLVTHRAFYLSVLFEPEKFEEVANRKIPVRIQSAFWGTACFTILFFVVIIAAMVQLVSSLVFF